MKFSIQNYLRHRIIAFYAVIAFLISGSILFLFKEGLGGKTFFMCVCLVASYYSFHYLNKDGWRQVSRGILIGISVLLLFLLLILSIKAAVSTAEWDFMCFYMQGMLGTHHLNFYDPNSFKILLSTNEFNYHFSDDFKSEILNVGLLSPPITMLLFAPIASVNIETSRIIFSVLVFIFIIINSYLATIIFFKQEKTVYSFLFIFILFMLLPGTLTTIDFNQTNFFLLFFLLLAMYNFDRPASGIFLSLSLIVKPLSGILILFYLFRKKWVSVIYFVFTGLILLLITGFIWGFHNIFGYLQSPPTQRIPQFLYEENVNQSLISILNQNLKSYGLAQHLVNFLYYLASGVILVLTILASNRLSKVNIYLSFFPFILCMLLIYPSSLSHYMVYLLPMLIYFLALQKSEKYLWLIILPALSFSKTEVFFSYLVLWSVLVYISFYLILPDDKEGKFKLGLTS